MARINSRLGTNHEDKLGNQHIWRLLNQKLNEFAYFRPGVKDKERDPEIGNFQIIGYSFGKLEGEIPELNLKYSGKHLNINKKGIKMKSRSSNISINRKTIISILTRLYYFYSNPSLELDEDFTEIYQIDIDLVLKSLERFLAGSPTNEDKKILMNYLNF